MEYFSKLLPGSSGGSSGIPANRPAPAPNSGSQLKADIREQSPISDIAEDDAIAAASIEQAMQNVEAVRSVIEASRAAAGDSAGAGAGGIPAGSQESLVKVEGARAGGEGEEENRKRERDVNMAFNEVTKQGREEREEGEVEEEMDELTDEPTNGIIHPIPNSAPTPAPAPQQEEDVEMEVIGSNITQRSPSPLPPPQRPIPADALTVTFRDANGYATNFRCKPTTKIQKLLQVFCSRYEAPSSNLRFITSEGRLLPKTDPWATVQNIEENGVRLRLNVGFGDFINNNESWKPIVDNIESSLDNYFKQENWVPRHAPRQPCPQPTALLDPRMCTHPSMYHILPRPL
ncbi:hypothetical protein NDA16_004946 [Ustilago loliicola]|nr:hypothetical protein NDA16_004946 [Ustilago loliicola]